MKPYSTLGPPQVTGVRPTKAEQARANLAKARRLAAASLTEATREELLALAIEERTRQIIAEWS